MPKPAIRAMRRRAADFESLWLITFADLMVQLMAFFAVMYSLSAQGQERLEQLQKALRAELGLGASQGTGDTGGRGLLPGGGALDPSRAADLERLLNDLQTTTGADAGAKLRVVGFRGSILFDEGSSVPDPSFEPLLKRMAELVREYPGFTLVCEGHAAPGERSRGGGDPWELSSQRAQAIARALTARGVPAALLTAEGRSDALVEGDPGTPEGRALQRRVKFRFQRAAER